MRAIFLLAAVISATPAFAADSITDFSNSMIESSRGAVTPLQMPDGRQLWRYAGKAPKGENGEASLLDRIAQSLALAQWCPMGWAETKRTPGPMGTVIVEGVCK